MVMKERVMCDCRNCALGTEPRFVSKSTRSRHRRKFSLPLSTEGSPHLHADTSRSHDASQTHEGFRSAVQSTSYNGLSTPTHNKPQAVPGYNPLLEAAAERSDMDPLEYVSISFFKDIVNVLHTEFCTE